MDPNPKAYPVLNYVLSRITSLTSKSGTGEPDFDIEQPPPPPSSASDDAPFVDPLVEQMPYLKDPKVVVEMAKAVSDIARTRSVLQALGDRPDHETVDRAKEKVVEIDSKLAAQLGELSLSQRPPEVNRDDWQSHLSDKEKERREAAEKEKAMYKAIIQLDEMHSEYAKLLKDAEKRLMKIYDEAAAARGPAKEVAVDGGTAEEGPTEEVKEEVVCILQQEAAGREIDRVDLSGRRLRFLPETFGKIRGLVALNLSNNQLEVIPETVASLESLEELNLSSNLLESLPESIGLLTNLKILNVSGNKLNALPDSICHCRSLVELDASFNNLSYLPTHLGDEMVNLRRLSVQYNKLQGLPTSVGSMKSLQQLDVQFNELRGLPLSIGNLTNLESLNLSGNFSDLKELPETFGELMNLKELDLSNNQIHKLPDSFGRLQNLIKINLEQNPIEIPPAEVVRQGAEAVKVFMAQRWVDILVEEEAKSMREVKEETESGWIRRSFSRSTSWLKQQVSSVSEHLGTPGGSPKDPWLDQQL